MKNWKIFQGHKSDETPEERLKRLPPPPPWRRFSQDSHQNQAGKKRGFTFQIALEENGERIVDLVNAALYLRRPLLVTGKPGTGKSSLAYAVADELNLGEVLKWPITTRTTLKDGLYYYDAIARLQEVQRQKFLLETIEDPEEKKKQKDLLFNSQEIGRYIKLGPLGTALLPSEYPRVLLIDEIDKSDMDLPNDLLHIFEEGEFSIPELERIAEHITDREKTISVRTAYKDEKDSHFPSNKFFDIKEGRIQCTSFPFVILTSNGEREFPPAFLRRCLRLDMPEPDEQQLERIVTAHLVDTLTSKEHQKKIQNTTKSYLETFMNKRGEGDLATDQFLNLIYLFTREYAPTEEKEKNNLIEQLLKYLNETED